MLRILLFLVFVNMTVPAYAENLSDSEQSENINGENLEQAQSLPSAEEINSDETNNNRQPEEIISYKIEHQKISLPECDDENLLQKTKEYVKSSLEAFPNNSTLFRRRRHFILKSLNNFSKENLANYKTSATSPISDIIADLRINSGIAEENMLLCKNENSFKIKRPIYLLVYPNENAYKVKIINLIEKQTVNDDFSFVLEK